MKSTTHRAFTKSLSSYVHSHCGLVLQNLEVWSNHATDFVSRSRNQIFPDAWSSVVDKPLVDVCLRVDVSVGIERKTASLLAGISEYSVDCSLL
jgi:hypothetical protein